MKINEQIIIAGFGGQGVLFAGKFLAYAGLMQNYEVAWLPSYGPEMRGGTANCNVTISENPIGSPIIIEGTTLIAMNGPSLDKFEADVIPGGKMFIDSTLISRKIARTDVDAFYIPATQMAIDNDLKGLANMIMVGKLLKETNICEGEVLKAAMAKTIPPKKADLFDKNMRAVELGYNYK